MEMNYFKKTGKMMVAACMLAGLPFIPGTVSASELQTQMMSVQMESTTLKELFDLIEEKFNYTFLIRNNDINLNERISIDMSNRSVEEILTTALKNQHADFVVNNNRIVVYKSSSNPNELRNTERMVAQQTITISGTIVDAVTGEPVIGANVLVKGTTNGTSTDFDGKFSLEAPAGATLVVSYIGYVNHEVKATSAPMTIRIKEDTQNLEEVVVVGYGVQKKESLTGAMQVVSNEKLLDATSPTVENLLSGKAPGVQVTSGGGQPGAAGKVVIRGKSTVNGSTDPLWIVDGVIVGTEAGSLNPADIESMSILKDAASTAIYGSQGANGVIVVTTKKGKIGKATINASVKMGVNQLHRGNMNMMNGEELYDYYKSFANQDALPSYFTEDLRNRNFDWWKEGTHLGFAQDYNVSVSGGSEKIKTYTSVGYYNEDGAVKGYDYKRYNLRFNVDYQATDWLTIKPKVWATRSDVMDQQQDLGAIMYVNFPWDSPYDENGDLIQQYRPTTWINSDATNYLYDLQWNYEKKTSYEFMGNFDFDIKFTDWLTFASVNNYKYNSILFKSYQDPRSKKGEADNGLLQDKTTASYRVYSNQLLRFNKVFDKHSINAILAYEWNTFTQEIKDQTAASFAPGFSVADVATTPKTIKGEQKEWAVQSYLFNANYAYDNRYLLSFSFRRDGASNFGTDAKYGNFFSVSGGWNIHQEEFFKAKDWVQQLKLRASYGSVGNRPTELYSQYTVYAMSTGYNGDPGAVIEQKENKNLTWEKTYTAGVGIMKKNKDKPFFLYYGLHQPHVPRVPNERFAGKSGMGPRGDVILEADWCVTEFLKEMDKLGLTENTLVIFTSDNGPVLDDGYQDQAVELVGDHKMAGPLRGGKTSLYDGGTCIPFMLRWPAEVKPGAVSDALVCQMDLLASLSALIGQTYSDKVDSQNTLPVFLGKDGNGRKELVLEGYFNYALRDGDWVMIPPYPDTYGDAEEAAFAGNSNCYQLYNVKEDIGQQVNLAEKEPIRLRQMMMTFERLKRETGKITNF